MKAGALWGRMVSCGGLATRLPRVGVPSNRWRTADFRECGGLLIRLRDAQRASPYYVRSSPARWDRRIANPPQVTNPMSLTSDPGGHSAQIGRQAFSLPPSSAIPFPAQKKDWTNQK